MEKHTYLYHFIIIGVLISFLSCKPTISDSSEVQDLSTYLMVYFKDDDHSLHMALSTNGYSFTDVNKGKAIIAGDTIASQKGIRDPHISRGPDGAFYVVMTDLHIFGKEKGYRDTQWERPGEQYDWGNNRGFVLMKSYDLIHWTHSNFLFDEAFESYKNIGCAWAPQTIYDPKEKKMMVYFTMRMDHGLTKMYYAYANEDFTALISEPKLLFSYPNDRIQLLDADITPMPDGRYCLTYVAQENPIGIKMAFSNDINKGYEYNPEWVDQEPGSCEAPNVWKRIDGNSWVLMYDIYGVNPHNFGFVETSNFKTFKNLGHFNEGVMKTTNFTSPKHGAIISLTKQEALRLAKHWNYNLKFD